MRNNLLKNNLEIKCRYKMYKAGKRWLFAGIMFLGATTALLIGGSPVAAASTSSVNTTPTAQTVATVKQTRLNQQAASAQKQSPTLKQSAPAKPAAVSTTKTVQNAAVATAKPVQPAAPEKVQAPQVGSDVATKPAATSKTAAVKPAVSTTTTTTTRKPVRTQGKQQAATPATQPVTSTQSHGQQPVRVTVHTDQQAGVNAAKRAALAQAAKTHAKSVEVDAVAGAVSNSITVRKGDDLSKYFNFNQTLSYDQQTGIVTFTDNNNQQSSITLRNKIALNQGFDLTGAINLGTKTQAERGGDGIAFGFHDANSGLVGLGGDGMGLGGIPDAIGWKADTTYNWIPSNDSTADPAGFGTKDPGPGYGGGKSFGAFISSNDQGIVSVTGKTAGADSAKVIPDPTATPAAPNGQFTPIELKYDPDVNGRKILTVTYGGQEWQKDITDWAANKTGTSFFISAGTAANANLQQFQLESFVYHPAASVDVQYVYTTEPQYLNDPNLLLNDPNLPVDPNSLKPIPNYVGQVTYTGGEFVNEPYFTYAASIPGYVYVRLAAGSLPATGNLQAAGNNGTVTYLYVKDGNGGQLATIRYVDATDNKQLGNIDQIEGPSNSTATYSDQPRVVGYEKSGYILESDDTAKGIVFDDNNNTVQRFTVKLRHATIPVVQAKQVTRTINYEYDDGTPIGNAAPTKTVTLQFTQKGKEDLVTKQTIYGAWSPVQTFAAVPSPAVKGYIPDVTTEPALTVDANQPLPQPALLNLVVKYSIKPQFKTAVGQPLWVEYKHKVGQPLWVEYKHKVGQPLWVEYKHKVGQPLWVEYKYKVGQPLWVEYKYKVGQPLWVEYKHKVGQPLWVEYKHKVGQPLWVEFKTQVPPAVSFTPQTQTSITGEPPVLPDTFGGTTPNPPQTPDKNKTNEPPLPDTFGGNVPNKPQTPNKDNNEPPLPDTFGGTPEEGPKEKLTLPAAGLLGAKSDHVLTDAGSLVSVQTSFKDGAKTAVAAKNNNLVNTGGQKDAQLPQTGDQKNTLLTVIGTGLAMVFGILGLTKLRKHGMD